MRFNKPEQKNQLSVLNKEKNRKNKVPEVSFLMKKLRNFLKFKKRI